MNKQTQKSSPNRTRKRDRNKLKPVDPLGSCERQAIISIPLEISTRVLSNPKQKLTAKSRKRFLRSRENVIVAPTKPAIEGPIKYAKRLTRLSLRQVIREIHKCARRAATAKHVLDDLSKDSLFRANVERAQAIELHKMKQAIAERDSRIKSK